MPREDSPLWRGIERLPPRPLNGWRYLLVNQAAFATRMKSIRRLDSIEKHALLNRELDACSDGATPFLLRAEGALGESREARAIRQLCADGCYACAISVLDSPLELRDMAASLTARCNVELPDHLEMLLRFFDTRIMEPLMDAFTLSQTVDFVSCTTEWYYAGRGGELELVSAPVRTGTDSFMSPLRLSAEQQAALIDAGEADAVVDLLARGDVAPLLDLPFAERHAAVVHCLREAHSWGLSTIPEVTAYCTLSLHAGADFSRRMPWSELLLQVQQGSMRFSRAMAIASEAGQ